MQLTNKIGVIVDSFRAGVREGLRKAKDAGADGVQLYAVRGRWSRITWTGLPAGS